MGPQRVVKPYNSKQETFSVRNELCGHEPRFCNNMHIIKIELSGSWLLRFAPRNCVLAFSPGVLSAPRVGTPPPFLLEASELVLFPLVFVGCLLCVRLRL